jgi:hypothetical protein
MVCLERRQLGFGWSGDFDLVDVDGDGIQSGAARPRIDGEPATKANGRARKSETISSQTSSVIFAIGPAPFDCDLDEFGRHARPIVDYGEPSWLLGREVRIITEKDINSAGPSLNSIVNEFGDGVRVTPVTKISDAPRKRISDD